MRVILPNIRKLRQMATKTVSTYLISISKWVPWTEKTRTSYSHFEMYQLCAFYDENICVCAETHCISEIGTERAAVLVTRSQSVHLQVIPLCLSQRWMISSFHSRVHKERLIYPEANLYSSTPHSLSFYLSVELRHKCIQYSSVLLKSIMYHFYITIIMMLRVKWAITCTHYSLSFIITHDF